MYNILLKLFMPDEHIEMRENQEVLHELNLIEKDVWLVSEIVLDLYFYILI